MGISIVRAGINRKTNFIFLCRVLALVCAILASIFYSSDFFNRTLQESISTICLFIICLNNVNENEVNAFLDGYKISVIINFIYCIFQAIFHIWGIEINSLLYKAINLDYYGRYMEILSRESITATSRVSGLIWDEYTIAMFCVTCFFLFENKLLKAISIIILVLSQSRAGLLACFASFAYYFWPKVKRKKTFLFAMIAIPVFLILVLNYVDLSRGFVKNSAGWKRIEYITLLPDVITFDHNPVTLFFGGSPAYTGAKFYLSQTKSVTNLYNRNPFWSIESDFLGILYGQGIFGFIVYLLFFGFIIKNQKIRKYKAIAIAIFAGGIGYNYYYAVFANMLLTLPTYYLNSDSELEDQ